MRALLTVCYLLVALGAHAAERVLDFHSDIRIAADGELAVTERISVQAEGREIRRGILRDFPAGFEVWRVTRNGQPETFAVERLPHGARVHIGSADVALGLGVHTYEIAYRAKRQLGFFDEHDELHWNVNGNGWTFAFDRLSAEVTLPAAVPAASLKAEAYTGPQGAQGRDYRAFTRDGAAAFRATRALAPGEGMTIVLSFPKGIVAPPSWQQRAREFLADNKGVLAGSIGLLALLLFLWRRAGGFISGS